MKWLPIAMVVLVGCAAPKVAGPPLPKVVPRPHFVPLATTVAAPTRTYWLRWNYTYSERDNTNSIVFNIRSIETNQFASPSYSWPVVGITNSLTWPFQINPQAKCVWFTVTASNTVNGFESDFARSQN